MVDGVDPGWAEESAPHAVGSPGWRRDAHHALLKAACGVIRTIERISSDDRVWLDSRLVVRRAGATVRAIVRLGEPHSWAEYTAAMETLIRTGLSLEASELKAGGFWVAESDPKEPGDAETGCGADSVGGDPLRLDLDLPTFRDQVRQAQRVRAQADRRRGLREHPSNGACRREPGQEPGRAASDDG